MVRIFFAMASVFDPDQNPETIYFLFLSFISIIYKDKYFLPTHR